MLTVACWCAVGWLVSAHDGWVDDGQPPSLVVRIESESNREGWWWCGGGEGEASMVAQSLIGYDLADDGVPVHAGYPCRYLRCRFGDGLGDGERGHGVTRTGGCPRLVSR